MSDRRVGKVVGVYDRPPPRRFAPRTVIIAIAVIVALGALFMALRGMGS